MSKETSEIIEVDLPLPEKSNEEWERLYELFCENFDLILKSFDVILQDEKCFYVEFKQAVISVAYIYVVLSAATE